MKYKTYQIIFWYFGGGVEFYLFSKVPSRKNPLLRKVVHPLFTTSGQGVPPLHPLLGQGGMSDLVFVFGPPRSGFGTYKFTLVRACVRSIQISDPFIGFFYFLAKVATLWAYGSDIFGFLKKNPVFTILAKKQSKNGHLAQKRPFRPIFPNRILLIYSI